MTPTFRGQRGRPPACGAARAVGVLFATSLATLAATMLAAFPAGLRGQAPDPQCGTPAGGSDPRTGGDACQRASDLFRYLTPQFGLLVAGGNATLGQGGPLGGPGRFLVTLRANYTGQFRRPSLQGQDLDPGPVRQNTFAVTEEQGAFPVADAAVGLVGGIRAGGVRLGGLDLLVNVAYIPKSVVGALESPDLSLSLPEGELEMGWGLRLGILGESRTLPGVALSFLRRAVPPLDAVTTTAVRPPGALPGLTFEDTLSLRGLSLDAQVWRVTVGKRLGPLSLSAGAGRDRYRAEGDLAFVVNDGVRRASGSFRFTPEVRATNVFADVGLDLRFVRLVAEAGRASGARVATRRRSGAPRGLARRARRPTGADRTADGASISGSAYSKIRPKPKTSSSRSAAPWWRRTSRRAASQQKPRW